MNDFWVSIWRDIAARTTEVDSDSVKGKKVLGLLQSGDIATAKQDIGMMRYVHIQLKKVLTDESPKSTSNRRI